MTNFPIDFLKINQPILGVIMDFNCPNSNDVIKEISEMDLFNQHFHWLIYDEYENIRKFQDTFRNVNLSIDTDVSYITTSNKFKSKNSTIFILYDIYNNGYRLGGHLNVTIDYQMECNRSHCLEANYLSDLSLRTKYGNRNNLRDITMRVAVVVTRYNIKAEPSEINEFLLTQKDFHLDPLARLGFQIFTLLQELLYSNVSLWYTNKWSDSDYTGGSIGALVTKQVDLISAPAILTLDRVKHLTPLARTGDFRSVCMFRTPSPNVGIHGKVLFEPFTTTVWLCFASILIIGGLLLWLAFYMEFRTLRGQLKYLPSLLTIGLVSLGSACVQGSHLIPSTMGGRLIFIVLTIIGFITYNYYTSVVVSILLGTPVKSPLKTMQDLADSDLIVGLEPLPYTTSYLNSSTRPDIKQFIKRKISSINHGSGIWLSAYDGIMRMLHQPGFVFVFETSTGFNLIEQHFKPHEICDLNAINFRSYTNLFTLLHRNSTYKEIVKLKILRILETGVHSKHRQAWVKTKLHCLSSNYIISVGFEYTAPLFILLVISYLLAFVTLLLEYLWKYLNERREKKVHVTMDNRT